MYLLGQGLPSGVSMSQAAYANIYFVGEKSERNRFVPSAATPLARPWDPGNKGGSGLVFLVCSRLFSLARFLFSPPVKPIRNFNAHYNAKCSSE